MFTLDKITETNGFDTSCKKNAIQNSYASCITELGDYIYVGTVRNALTTLGCSKKCIINIPPWIIKGTDNNAEIWRYKRDGSRGWERVFRADCNDKIKGFSSLITHSTDNEKAMYAAGLGTKIYLIKSIDGITWTKVNTKNVLGTTCKCLLSFKGKLYLSTIKIGFAKNTPFLYESKNPDCKKFKPVIDTENMCFDSNKNPVGRIENLNEFNNKLYVGISTNSGCELWRSINSNPKTNEWVKIGNSGFYDRANSNIIASYVFKNHLYISCTKNLPLSLFAPLGFDIIRVDVNDNVDVVVGGDPLIPLNKCDNNIQSLSGYKSGFNNFFNIYGWQINCYCGTLFITTLDNSTNMKLIRDTIIYNSDQYIEKLGYANYNELLSAYTDICNIITCYKYPKGFDIYTSTDGIHFKSLTLNGLDNKNNYGGSSLFKSCNGLMYLGTANPYDGCEVWEINKNNFIEESNEEEKLLYLETLKKINKQLMKIYPKLLRILSSTSCIDRN